MNQLTVNSIRLVVFLGSFFLGIGLDSNPASSEMQRERLENLLHEGQIAFDRSKYQEALGYWREGLKQAKTRKSELRNFRAPFLMNIGRVFNRLSRYKQALLYHRRALALYKTMSDQGGEAKVLINIGNVLANLGEFEEAGDNYSQSLSLARKLKSWQEEALALANLGVISHHQGQYEKALDKYERALSLYQLHENQIEQARILNNRGVIYRDLGQYDQARRNLELALALYQRLETPAGEGLALSNLGAVFEFLGQYEKALDFHRDALALHHKLKTPVEQAADLTNIGNVYDRLGQYERAIEYYHKALNLYSSLESQANKAGVLNNLGVVYRKAEKFEDALNYQRQALVLTSRIGAPDLLWRVLHHTQLTYTSLQQPQVAIFFGKQAVNVLQDLRSNIQGFEKTIQRSFLEERREAYEELASLLIDEGRLLEAEQVLAMYKEEEYFHFLRRRGKELGKYTPVPFTQLERDLVKRYEKISASLVTSGQKHLALLKVQESRKLIPTERDELQKIEYDLDVALKAFPLFLRELQDAFAATPRKKPRHYPEQELTHLEGFRETLASLGSGTTALHFLSTKDKLRIIVTSGNSSIPPIHRDSLIGELELNKKIAAYRQTLQDPRVNPLPQGENLYSLLFQPIASDLENLGAKTVLLYLDGALRYLPLGALHNGDKYVAEQYGLVMYTPAAKERLDDPPTSSWRAAGLGVSKASQEFPALVAVPAELDAIIKEDRSDDSLGVLPGVTYLDQEFTKENLSLTLRHGYPIIHIASHFRFGAGTDEDSFLVLGGGEKLTLTDLVSMKYPLMKVELLTLSACETGLAGETRDGREVEGLGVLAQKRGAKAVFATLWKVADRSTGKFMRWFYHLRQKKRLTKAEALRRVQQIFIRGSKSLKLTQNNLPGTSIRESAAEGETAFVVNPSAPFSHPFFWAPFILMGNFL